MRFWPLLLTLSICAAPVLADDAPTTAPATTVPSAPPQPEAYLDNGLYSDYARAAIAFMRGQPDSPSAPRVAMDLLVASASVNDQGSFQLASRVLVAIYPTSVQARFLIDHVLRDGAQFSRVMSEIADENFVGMPAGFPAKYDQALTLGVNRFGASALGDGPALARTCALTLRAGDQNLSKAALQILSNGGAADAQCLQALTIFLDGKSTELDRLAKLHALTDRSAAAAFEGYLLAHLSAADKATNQVQIIEADDTLAAGNFAVALPILTKVADPDARLQFWTAWAKASTGDATGADTLFHSLMTAHPDDPWAKEAADLEPAVIGMDATMSRGISAAVAASKSIARGIDLLEAHALYTRADGSKIDMYVGYGAGSLLEFLGNVDGTPGAAYRATDQDASVYLPGFTTIAHFDKPALLPLPLVALGRMGHIIYPIADLRFTYSFDDVAKMLTNLSTTGFPSTQEGITDLLHGLAAEGILPLPPQTQADGQTVFTWVSPAVATPDVRKVSFTVGADGSVTGFANGKFSIVGLHYGKTGSFALNTPDLPKLPAAEKGRMDTGVVQPVLQSFYQLFNPPPPSTQPAPTTQP